MNPGTSPLEASPPQFFLAILTLASICGANPVELVSRHYRLWSTSPPVRTQQAQATVESLHQSWESWAGPKQLNAPQWHRLRLFGSRVEMRNALPGLGWAEAIYHDSTCDQYDDVSAIRPWHWLVHEATHQLVWEDAQLSLPRWANEGLACLFSTSRLSKGRIVLGSVDRETYPVWWLTRTTYARRLVDDLRNGRLIAPSQILTESNLIDISASLNAHYLTWWSMVHFFNAENPAAWKQWILVDGTNAGLLQRFGPIESLDQRWYAHVQALRDSVAKP